MCIYNIKHILVLIRGDEVISLGQKRPLKYCSHIMEGYSHLLFSWESLPYPLCCFLFGLSTDWCIFLNIFCLSKWSANHAGYRHKSRVNSSGIKCQKWLLKKLIWLNFCCILIISPFILSFSATFDSFSDCASACLSVKLVLQVWPDF